MWKVIVLPVNAPSASRTKARGEGEHVALRGVGDRRRDGRAFDAVLVVAGPMRGARGEGGVGTPREATVAAPFTNRLGAGKAARFCSPL
ncbi:hypothetical protein ABZ864_10980 [Streptomyces sp. NPDC047082]|uniref:hypothetical protein n=1 Tax=Streptomyces sp. NPDC047082 TaxID=3155259 RepID=UPI0033DCED6E